MPSGPLRSLPQLTGAARGEGFTNAPEDLDGTLRRVPLLLTVDGKDYPSLAFAALLAASPDRHIQLAREDSENILRWAGRNIPLDASGVAGGALINLSVMAKDSYGHVSRTVTVEYAKR